MKRFFIILLGLFLSLSVAFGTKNCENKNFQTKTLAEELLDENQFEVNFYDDDKRTLLYHEVFSKGETVVYNGTYPHKNITSAYRYVFDCWLSFDENSRVELSEITSSTNVYARYNSYPIDYNVTYYLNGASESSNPVKYNIESGEKITLAEPTLEGKTFLGWIGTDLSVVTKTVEFNASDLKNREYFAVFEEDDFEIKFENNSETNFGSFHLGGEDLGQSVSKNFMENFEIDCEKGTVTLGEETISAAPLEDSKAYKFEFAGLNYDFSLIDGNQAQVTIIANYSRTPIDYKIDYILHESVFSGRTSYNIETQSFTLPYPYKAGFTFVGWTDTSIEDDPVTKDVFIEVNEDNLRNREYEAHFTEEEYTVTFAISETNDGFGTLDKESVKVKYGTSVTYSGNQVFVGDDFVVTATPSKNTNEFLYSFGFWSNVPSTVTKSVTIFANFSRQSRSYRVYFDSTLTVKTLDDVEVFYGQTFNYNTELVVFYTESENHHKASLQCNETELEDITFVENGGSAHFFVTETTFLTYEEAWDTFTVTFSINKPEAGKINSSESLTIEDVVYGTEVIVSENVLTLRNGETSQVFTAVANGPTEEYSFGFLMWETNGVSTVTSNTEFVAIFQDLLTEKIVTFPSNVKVTSIDDEIEKVYSSGDIVLYGTVLTISYTETEHFHKTSFKINGDESENNATFVVHDNVTVTYDEAIDTFTVTYSRGATVRRLNGGTILSGSEVEYGSMLVADYTLSPNHKCESFTLNGAKIEKGQSFEVTENVEIIFLEVKEKIAIKTAETENGSFTVSAESIEAGEEVKIFVTPDEFYSFERAYYITKSSDVVSIDGSLTFIMPDDEVTVYVVFKKDYYVLTNSFYGVTVAIKIDEVEAEPTLVVTEKTNYFSNYAKTLYGAGPFKVIGLELKIGERTLSSFVSPLIVKFSIPDGYDLKRIRCFKISETANSVANSELEFELSDGNVARLSVSELGNLAIGSFKSETAQAEIPETPTKNSTKTLIIVVISVAVAMAVTTFIIVFVVIKRKRKRKI